MKSTLKVRLRVALPIIAGVALASLQAAAQQQRFYGATGYGTSVVGAYNPYTQAGPGQTAGRAYGAPPVAPYPQANGAYGPQRRGYAAPAAVPTRYPQPSAGQVAAYNPWRMQHGGGAAPAGRGPAVGGPAVGGPAPGAYVPYRGSVAAYNPAARAPYGGSVAAYDPGTRAPYGPSVAAYNPGANLPQPPSGRIRSRLVSIPEVGRPQGAAAPFHTVPYVPRRTAGARPQMAPRRTVATAPAPRPTQLASGGMGGPAMPPTPTPRTTTPLPSPPSAAKPPEPPRQPVPVVAAAPKPAAPPAAPTIAAKPPQPPEPPKSVAPPPPPAAVAKPPKPAPVVAAAPPRPDKPPAPPRPAPAAAAVMPPPPKPDAPPPAPPPTTPTPVKSPAAAPTRVTFQGNSPALSADARASLDKLAAELIAHPDRRATLKAYSGGTVGSETRRLSLARGLAVRAYLIDKGVPRERLDVQALGTSADGGPADRVDAVAGAGT